MATTAPPTTLIVIGVSLAGLKLGGMKLALGLVAGAPSSCFIRCAWR